MSVSHRNEMLSVVPESEFQCAVARYNILAIVIGAEAFAVFSVSYDSESYLYVSLNLQPNNVIVN